MLKVNVHGSFDKTGKWLHDLKLEKIFAKLDSYAQQGVEALAAATPVDSGITANSWSYEIRNSQTNISIIWKNSHIVKGVPIAIILQYGHGTGTGGYVQGRDYINPAMRPIFDAIEENVCKEIVKL